MTSENVHGCEPVFDDLQGQISILRADIRALESDREDLLQELRVWRCLSALRLAGLFHDAVCGRGEGPREPFRPSSEEGKFLVEVCGVVLANLRDMSVCESGESALLKRLEAERRDFISRVSELKRVLERSDAEISAMLDALVTKPLSLSEAEGIADRVIQASKEIQP